MHIANLLLASHILVFHLHHSPFARTTHEETHERGGSSPPRGDQGTGTQGSPVDRRSRFVDVDGEVRAGDHPQVPDSRLVPSKTPTGRVATRQQAVPLLTSAALRRAPHHAVELVSGSWRSPLPGLGSTLPVLLCDLPVLRPDLPGSSTPLSGEHVPPSRGHVGQLPRGRGGRRPEITFSGHSAGVQQDAVAPHSTTAAHTTTPALSAGSACVSQAAACVSPAAARVSSLDARRASLALAEPRVAVPESETVEHEFQNGRRLEINFAGNNAGAQQDAVVPHSTPLAAAQQLQKQQQQQASPGVAQPPQQRQQQQAHQQPLPGVAQKLQRQAHQQPLPGVELQQQPAVEQQKPGVEQRQPAVEEPQQAMVL